MQGAWLPARATVVLGLTLFATGLLIIPAATAMPGAGAPPDSLQGSHLGLGPDAAAGVVNSAQESLAQAQGPAAGASWTCNGSPELTLQCHPKDSTGAGQSSTSLGWEALGGRPPLSVSAGLLTYDAAESATLLLSPSYSGSYNTLNYSTWSFTNGAWFELNVSVAPPVCPGASLAYDDALGEAIYLGGSNCSSADQTWAFAGASWVRLHPATSPVQRDYASLAYDPRDGELILFGGINESCGPAYVCDDTWAFANDTWTNLTGSITGSPGGRYDAPVVYDSTDQDLVLFGGIGDGPYLNDTWSFNGTGWTEVDTASAPPAVYRPLLAADPDDGYLLLLWGDSTGCTTTACPGPDWSFNGSAWHELSVAESLPAAGEWSAVYDASSHVVLASSTGGLTWTYHGGLWTNQSGSAPPPGRADASMTYDAADGYVLLFGGYAENDFANGVFLDDTWTYHAGNWTNITATAGTPPSAREGAAIAYDPADGYVLLFGGQSPDCTGGPNPSAPVCGDTWEFVGGQWSELSPRVAPSARSGAGLVFDPSLDEMVLFGGSYEYGLNDTWSFRSGNWTNLTGSLGVAPPPTPDAGPAFAYDASDGYAVLFGGGQVAAPYFNNETWAFETTGWVNLTGSVSGAPPPEVGGALDFDPAFNESILFGGCLTPDCARVGGGTYTYVNDAWASIFASRAPSARQGANVAYDAADNYLFLFGGRVSDGTTTSDTWAFGLVPGSLTIRGFTASPASTDVGGSVSLTTVAGGGSGSLGYSYVGLPTGCPSENVSSLVCVPSEAGTFSVAVVVNDTEGDLASAQLQLTIRPDPVAQSFGAFPSRVAVGNRTLIELAPSLGTPPYLLTYTGLPAGCITQSVPDLPCYPSLAGNYSLEATVADAAGFVGTANATLTVVPAGAVGGPAISEFEAAPADLVLGNSTLLTVVAGAGKAPLSYAYGGLPPGCVSSNTSALMCSPSAAGAYFVTVGVTGPSGELTQANLTLNVEPAGGAGSPQVLSFAAQPDQVSVGESTFFQVMVNASSSVSYAFTGLPDGCGSANLSRLACGPRVPGNYTVTVRVTGTTGNTTTVPTRLEVTGVSVPPPANPSGRGGGAWTVEVAVVAVAVAVAIGSAWAIDRSSRRRKRQEGLGWISDMTERPPSDERRPGQ